ncbi:hypothetical protein [Coralloluteibacterium thermophilus]|uniref:Uncharacterized protein n=1 Tax=Coralloluteibacterium thermophilum TaxID=2707049 RepID=A0ABV9NMI3_9GAMM
MAQLVALRAKRKLGMPRELHVVGAESAPKEPAPDQPSPQEPRALPDGITFQAIDVSPRAKLMRGIVRIADTYGWHSAIVHFLETKGVSYLSDLTDPQLEDLMDRMEGYVDAAEIGASLDGFPAW